MFKKLILSIILSIWLLIPTVDVFGKEEGEHEVYLLYRDSQHIFPVTFEQILLWADSTGKIKPGHVGLLIVPPDGDPYIIDTYLYEGVRKIPFDEKGIHRFKADGTYIWAYEIPGLTSDKAKWLVTDKERGIPFILEKNPPYSWNEVARAAEKGNLLGYLEAAARALFVEQKGPDKFDCVGLVEY